MNTPELPPASSLILYQTEDGQTRIQCRFEQETIWLTQIQMAELFQTSVPNIKLHLKAIFAEGELAAKATIKSCLIVRSEGSREVSRPVFHYSLPAILAVGFRVRSHRGTQFRQWATARLSEYLVKGFTMDDERLKNPPGPGVPDCFDELLERIRDIRASERRVYLRVAEIARQHFDAGTALYGAGRYAEAVLFLVEGRHPVERSAWRVAPAAGGVGLALEMP